MIKGRAFVTPLRLEHALIVLLVTVTAFRILTVFASHLSDQYIDFRPLYCAGSVLRSGADPYAASPLLECEVKAGFDASNAIVPAPLPGYVLGPAALLAALPYGTAVLLFSIAGLAAYVGGTWCLARLAQVWWPAVFLFAFVRAGYEPIGNGQLAVFAFAALAVAAYGASRERHVVVGAAVAVAMLQPQVGLPLLIATAIFVPRARVPLAFVVAILAVTSLVTLGLHGNMEYFAREIPSQAAAEVHFPFNMSLTWLLAALGAPDDLALRLGSLSYAVTLASGLFVAAAFARRDEIALALMTPPAYAMLGGTYVHAQQVAAILPLAVVLTARARRAFAIPAVAGLLVSLEPSFLRAAYRSGGFLVNNLLTLLGFAGVSARPGRRVVRALVTSTLLFAVVETVAFGTWRALPPAPEVSLTTRQHVAVAHAGPPASDRLKIYNDAKWRGRPLDLRLLALKSYAWVGIVLLLGFTFAAAREGGLLENRDLLGTTT